MLNIKTLILIFNKDRYAVYFFFFIIGVGRRRERSEEHASGAPRFFFWGHQREGKEWSVVWEGPGIGEREGRIGEEDFFLGPAGGGECVVVREGSRNMEKWGKWETTGRSGEE